MLKVSQLLRLTIKYYGLPRTNGVPYKDYLIQMDLLSMLLRNQVTTYACISATSIIFFSAFLFIGLAISSPIEMALKTALQACILAMMIFLPLALFIPNDIPIKKRAL
jgi:hypothetical protein